MCIPPYMGQRLANYYASEGRIEEQEWQLLSNYRMMTVRTGFYSADGERTFFAQVPGHLKSEKKFMIEAVRISPTAYEYATPDLQKDEELIKAKKKS